MPERNLFISLELGRFVAAFLVCMFHASGTVATFHGDHPFGDIVRAGHIGVEYFFLLSGFLMYFIHAGDIGKSGTLRPFVLKRIIRIIPLYWIVTTVLLILALVAPGVGKARTPDAIVALKNYLLIASDVELYLGVAWTLKREFLFYGLLAIGLLIPRIGFRAFWAWQAAIVIANLYDPAWSSGARGHVVLGVYNLGFGLGALIAISVRRGTLRNGTALTLLAAGVAATLGLALTEWWVGAGTSHDETPLGDVASPLLYLASCSLIVTGAVHIERNRPFAGNALSTVLGGSSYALYLFHGLAISAIVRAIRPSFGLAPELVFIAAVAAAVALSIAVHLTVEKPVLRMLRSGLLRRPGAAVAREVQ